MSEGFQGSEGYKSTIVSSGSQILDGVLEGRHFVDSSVSFYHYDDFYYSTSPTIQYEVEGTFGTNDAVGGIIDYVTGAVAGNRARLGHSNISNHYDPNKDLIGVFRAASVQTTNTRWFIGFFEALPTAVEPSVEPSNGLYFRRIDGATVANWFAVSRDTDVETAVDTGVVGNNAYHNFKIVKIGNSALFYIDNVLVATISTTAFPENLAEAFVVVTRNAVAKTIQIDTLLTYNKR